MPPALRAINGIGYWVSFAGISSIAVITELALDGASQRGGGRAPHQLAEELRPPAAAARRLPAGGRGPDAGGRRQVEVGRVEAEPRPAGGVGPRLRGAEGEERRQQQRPEPRGARRRGHPAPGSALATSGRHCPGGGRAGAGQEKERELRRRRSRLGAACTSLTACLR